MIFAKLGLTHLLLCLASGSQEAAISTEPSCFAGSDAAGSGEGSRNEGQRSVHSAARSLLQAKQNFQRADAADLPDKDFAKLAHDPAPQHWLDDESACTFPLVGTRNRRFIGDDAISASSRWPDDSSATGPPVSWAAEQSRMDNGVSCWLAAQSDDQQWIKWDFGSPKLLQIIQTKGRMLLGRDGDRQMVTEYRLEYSLDGQNWTWLDGNFSGNEVRFYVHENKLDPPIVARWLALHPTQWKNQIALRAEVLGCNPPPCALCGKCEQAWGSTNANDADCAPCAGETNTSKWPCSSQVLCRCANTYVPKLAPHTCQGCASCVGARSQTEAEAHHLEYALDWQCQSCALGGGVGWPCDKPDLCRCAPMVPAPAPAPPTPLPPVPQAVQTTPRVVWMPVASSVVPIPGLAAAFPADSPSTPAHIVSQHVIATLPAAGVVAVPAATAAQTAPVSSQSSPMPKTAPVSSPCSPIMPDAAPPCGTTPGVVLVPAVPGGPVTTPAPPRTT